MNNLGDKNNFFKNPIGVIGIFLVLTEAIASIVIVKSTLNDLQNTILVLFISLFPCLILGVFYILVTRHHEKLYSPSDYKDEQNFVNIYNNTTQKNERKRVDSSREELDKNLASTDYNINTIKEALINIMEWQKKIVSITEDDVITEDDKRDYVTSIDEHLSEMEEYEDNVLKVEISPMYKANKLVEKYVQRGYVANIYRSDYYGDKKVLPNAEHNAIWLGSEVPVNMAIDVIKIAKNFYPHLKYIELNDGNHGEPEYALYEVYIGGATSTAEERGLKALNNNDFETLYEIDDASELHKFIETFGV